MSWYSFKIIKTSDDKREVKIIKNKLRYAIDATEEYETKDEMFYFFIDKGIVKVED